MGLARSLLTIPGSQAPPSRDQPTFQKKSREKLIFSRRLMLHIHPAKFNGWNLKSWKFGSDGSSGFQFFVIFLSSSKTLPTDPWSIPQTPNQQFMFRNSFHLGVKGDVWGMLQGYVGFPLEFHNMFIFQTTKSWDSTGVIVFPQPKQCTCLMKNPSNLLYICCLFDAPQ